MEKGVDDGVVDVVQGGAASTNNNISNNITRFPNVHVEMKCQLVKCGD